MAKAAHVSHGTFHTYFDSKIRTVSYGAAPITGDNDSPPYETGLQRWSRYGFGEATLAIPKIARGRRKHFQTDCE